ncbi:hypothetical protein P280DRAFT_545489 [Massarina eburnea CBS 473.64]|uniref:Uncharacterized protein n=1 Tax=Massarina eburnea CBS 473.64 TaxID=1395130 RepID=A0A6A6SE02_9PLEO|nr:hypothetical protein P280DRAFT_545489 [Massarina eburnea CBS 473.64]
MEDFKNSHTSLSVQKSSDSTPKDYQYHGHPQSMTNPQAHYPTQNFTQQASSQAPNMHYASLNGMMHQDLPVTLPQRNISTTVTQPQETSVNHVYRTLLPKPSKTTHPNAHSIPHDPIADFFTSSDQQQQQYSSSILSSALPYANLQDEYPVPEETTPTHHEATHLQKASAFSYSRQSSTDRWQLAHEYRIQVYEPPQVDPKTDHTITQVSHDAERWVNALIRAIVNTNSVKDTSTSHALRMFLPGAYDPLLIEACARQIFTYLLDRCTHGFRGPVAFNKALRPARDLEPDRTASCEERITNVVEVLSWNKRVCKDVLFEDWKIRLFVNHPLSYDKEKDSQKGSNDQRRKRLVEERERLKGAQEELKAIKGNTESWDAGMKRVSDDGLDGVGDAKRQRVGM